MLGKPPCEALCGAGGCVVLTELAEVPNGPVAAPSVGSSRSSEEAESDAAGGSKGGKPVKRAGGAVVPEGVW